MYGYIYKTTNLINNNIYIGQHKSLDYDASYLGSGTILNFAIAKYGRENFQNEVIDIANNQDELNNLEIKYIKFYKEKYPNNCYNIAAGGEGGDLLRYNPEAKRRSIEKMKETRKRLGIFLGESNPMYKSGERGIHPLLGSKRSEETKNKISNSLKGNIPWNKGTAKIKTEEEKAEIKLKRYLENRHVTPIKVVNLDSNEEMYFSSKKECEDFFGFNIRYRLKVRKLKDENLAFERITTKEYVDKMEVMPDGTSQENQPR